MACYVVGTLALTGATASWTLCVLGVLTRGSTFMWYCTIAPLCAMLVLFLLSYLVAAVSDPGAVPSSHAQIREANQGVFSAQPRGARGRKPSRASSKPHMRPDVTGKWSAAVAPWMSAGLMVQTTAARRREGPAAVAHACAQLCSTATGCYCGESASGTILPYKLSKAKPLFRDARAKTSYQSVGTLGGYSGSGSDRGEVGSAFLPCCEPLIFRANLAHTYFDSLLPLTSSTQRTFDTTGGRGYADDDGQRGDRDSDADGG